MGTLLTLLYKSSKSSSRTTELYPSGVFWTALRALYKRWVLTIRGFVSSLIL
jgi:hypothetical protein